MIAMLANLLKALNSDSAPGQVALAFALGLITGLTPLFSLHNVLIIFIACIVRINFGAFLLATAFFSGLAYLLDPAAIALGESLLTNSDYQEFWTGLYQNELLRVSGFNNTLVMGSLVIALIAFIPVLLLSRWLILAYRDRLMVWVDKLKITKLLKASKFYKAYQALAE
ncbi:TIGR03546 family protein [Oleispira antarctica]|uniref:TIGR03546 family protein n=1 Tax=Oleispira antarctica TaxID=188908 RepID=A0A1Y5I1Y7_OLEAN|nr:TIGR03546 family protein [Oleispira antarctica]